MSNRDVEFSILILNREVHEHIINLMNKYEYSVVAIVAGIDGLIASLKGKENVIIFIDSDAIVAYGVGAVSKLKMACQECRVILLCSQKHRSVVKPVMELGAYGCIIEPYPEWELLTMVRPILMDLQRDRKAKPGKIKPRLKKP